MKKFTVTGLVLLLISIGVSARIGPPAPSSTLVPGVDYVPGQVLVKFMPELRALDVDPAVELSEYRLGLLREYPQLGWNLMAVPEDEPLGVLRTIADLMEDPRIENATPNYLLQLHTLTTWTPNDWYYTQGHLWNMDIIGMPEAWALDTSSPLHGGDPDIIVGVIDTGVAYMDYNDTTSHPGTTVVHAMAPDFSETNFVHGWNWTYDSQYALDDNGHGTHVAGTIAQSTNNDPGGGTSETQYSAAGIAFNTTIMPLKTAARQGSSQSVHVAEAIIFAADNGAHVINMSLGSGGVGMYPPFDIQYDACQYAYDLGVVIVSSSGNDADSGWSAEFNGVGYPAGYPSVIAVGASNSRINPGDPNTEFKSSFSQYGVTSEVLAPSGDFTSGDHDNSGKVDTIFQQDLRSQPWPNLTTFVIRGHVGTSMASPHVAGQAALILAYAKQMGWNITNEEVRARIAASAADLNHAEFPGYDYYYGFGRINVPASMTIDLKPSMVVREAHVFEGPGQGNGNYRPEPGETVSMNVDLMVRFADASGITANVTSNDPMITVHSSTIHYPDTARFQRAQPVDPVIFTISSDCPINYKAQFQIVVSCDQEADRVETFHAVVTTPRVLFWKDCRYAGKTNFQDQSLLDALENAGIAYDMHVTAEKENVNRTEKFRYPWEEFEFFHVPTYDLLKQYEAVIWYIGERGGTSRREYGEKVLPEVVRYLDNGGNMLITGHEFLFTLARPEWDGEDRVVWIDPASTPNPDNFDEYNHWFVYNYLNVAGIDHDNHFTEVMGSPSDPVTRGIHQTLDKMVYNKRLDYYWWPDNLAPRERAVPMMYSGPPVRPGDDYPESQGFFDGHYPYEMSERTCAVRYEGDFRMIFASYPIEAADNAGLFLVPAVNWLLTGEENASEILVNVDTNYRWAKFNSSAEPPRGDPFELYGYLYNPGSPVPAQRWVLMQIFDMFWAWPTWESLDEGYAYMDVTIPSGHSRQQFLAFDWPDVDGTFDGIIFWFAHLNEQAQLLGTFDYCVFGYY